MVPAAQASQAKNAVTRWPSSSLRTIPLCKPHARVAVAEKVGVVADQACVRLGLEAGQGQAIRLGVEAVGLDVARDQPGDAAARPGIELLQIVLREGGCFLHAAAEVARSHEQAHAVQVVRGPVRRQVRAVAPHAAHVLAAAAHPVVLPADDFLLAVKGAAVGRHHGRRGWAASPCG